MTVADPSFFLSKFPIPAEFSGATEQLVGENQGLEAGSKRCENQIRVSVELRGEEEEGEMGF